MGIDENPEQQIYHKNLRIKSAENCGRFYQDYTRLDDSLYDIMRQSGSSTLSKAMDMPLDELASLIDQCKRLQPDDIRKKVENYMTEDLEAVIDGTYMQGL